MTQKTQVLATALHGDGELGQAWAELSTWPHTGRYARAVRTVLDHHGEVRAAAVLWVPPKPSAEWNKILGASHPLCGCGQRRIMSPSRSRYELIVADDHTYEVASGKEAQIVPWGGDHATTLVNLAVRGGTLLVEYVPSLRGCWMDEWWGRDFEIKLPLDDIRRSLHGGDAFHISVTLLDARYRPVSYPVCAVTEVGDSGEVRVALDASVWFRQGSEEHAHDCNP